MKRWKRWLLFVFVLVAAFPALIYTKTGLQMVDRSERALKMTLYKLYFRWKTPLPSTPELDRLKARLAGKDLKIGAPIFMRIFKKEAKLEIWIRGKNRFRRFATYPICYFSGKLGPKRKRGDRQAPEGFYTVSKGQLNPNSRWHRSFNLGYPNLFDRSHKRTGDYLMVHGGCSSIGCYAMTNEVIDEIWKIVTAALNKGQKRFHVHVYPFRMTKWNMHLYRNNKWLPFWRDLQKGYALFERTKVPPHVSVCKGRYQTRTAGKNSKGTSALVKKCVRRARLSPRS